MIFKSAQIFKSSGIILQNWLHFLVISIANQYSEIWDVGLNTEWIRSEIFISF